MWCIFSIRSDFIYPVHVTQLVGKDYDHSDAMRACHREILQYQEEAGEVGAISLLNDNDIVQGYIWEKPNGSWVRVVAVLVSLNNI